jgi:glycosyltransferase involved in cell wall biosynthesis
MMAMTVNGITRRFYDARPLSILHVTPYYAGAWGYGGIPRVVATLARDTARLGHAVTVATTDAADATSRAHHERDDLVRVETFPNVSNRLAYGLQLFLPRGLDRWLRDHVREYDVVHIHACHNVPGARAARRARMTGVPYVLQPHGTAPFIERRRLLKRAFDATLGRGVLSGASAVIAVSDAERRQLLSLGVPNDRIHVVPNPVDLSEFASPVERGRFRARWGLGERRIVAFLGKLTPRKRVDVLIDAVATSRHEATLVIAGNDLGAGASLRRRVARRHLQGRTVFTGLLRGSERLDVLADADVVVYPSRDEVFGLVPVEALCAGTPVVVADDNGCGEVIGQTGGGLVVRQGDAGALASAIGEILDHPGRWRDETARARVIVHERFAPDVIARHHAEVYCTRG